MKDNLLQRIRQFGHWRVNFRPASLPIHMLSLQECQTVVEQSVVSMRGWDFPHVSRGDPEQGRYERTDDYLENWTDWSGMVEFWRMYRSTQFLAYQALREDTKPDYHDNPPVPVLNFIGAVYSVTEFFEFAHRLGKRDLYREGVFISLSLRNTRGRVLVAGRGRIPLFDDYSTQAEQLEFKHHLDPTMLKESHREVAVQACLNLFDRFGWNPDQTQIAAEQDRFYERRFAY